MSVVGCVRFQAQQKYIYVLIYVDSGLSFDASSEVGGRTWPLRLKGARPGEQGGTSSIRGFWLLETSCDAYFHLDVVLFHHVSGF